jgi:hypothetical protein
LFISLDHLIKGFARVRLEKKLSYGKQEGVFGGSAETGTRACPSDGKKLDRGGLDEIWRPLKSENLLS